jgi:hypothetical protein
MMIQLQKPKANVLLIKSIKQIQSKRLVFTRNGVRYHKCLECQEIEKKGLEYNLNRKPKLANKPFPHLSLCGERGKF